MFFNEDGILNIDEMIIESPSFQKIMEDGVVTDEELAEQAGKVVAQLREMETKFNEEQIAEIKKLLVESNVLQAIYNIHAKQNL